MWWILVIDDDRLARETLGRACAGFAAVQHAPTAGEAERALQRQPADLVVLEYRLRDACGLDVLARLKASYPQLPVIMSTAYGSEVLCAAALKLGIRDYFIKPWSPPEMGASIRAILGAATRRAETRQNVLGSQGARGRAPALADRNQPIHRAAEFVRQHYGDSLSLGQVARAVGLSKWSMSRRFKAGFNVPYRRYVMECRLARARELLETSSFTVTEIAQMVGFGDLPRFDKVFKASVGISPSRYRRSLGTAPAAGSCKALLKEMRNGGS